MIFKINLFSTRKIEWTSLVGWKSKSKQFSYNSLLEAVVQIIESKLRASGCTVTYLSLQVNLFWGRMYGRLDWFLAGRFCPKAQVRTGPKEQKTVLNPLRTPLASIGKDSNCKQAKWWISIGNKSLCLCGTKENGTENLPELYFVVEQIESLRCFWKEVKDRDVHMKELVFELKSSFPGLLWQLYPSCVFCLTRFPH